VRLRQLTCRTRSFSMQWKKDSRNPMMRHMVPRADTLGCTNGWRLDGRGNWTTTIELDAGCYGACAVTFWTSKNYVNWSYVGNLTGLPPAFAKGIQDCSDFFPAPGPAAAGKRWIFGDNRGGAITGTCMGRCTPSPICSFWLGFPHAVPACSVTRLSSPEWPAGSGTFERHTLTFRPDRPQLSTGLTDRQLYRYE
jgi:hypothetical protein